MGGTFWLSDRQWSVLEPLLPTNQPGARRTDDRRVISGIVHMLRNGGRWQDCPPCYGPSTTIYNRYHRWSGRGLWAGMLTALVEATPGGLHLIDSTTTKAHRSAAGGKGADAQALGRSRGGRGTKIHLVTDGLGRVLALTLTPGQRGDAPPAHALLAGLPAPEFCLADAAYDSDALRNFMLDRGTEPVIPNNPRRKHIHPFDRTRYKQRNLIERTVGRLKDWRRIHTRYDKLARNFASAISIAAILHGWC